MTKTTLSEWSSASRFSAAAVQSVQAASVFWGHENRPDRAEGGMYVRVGRPGRDEGALYVQLTCLDV